jgi:hypothetical protein
MDAMNTMDADVSLGDFVNVGNAMTKANTGGFMVVHCLNERTHISSNGLSSSSQ